MGLFTKRIKKIQHLFDGLEHFLTEKGVIPCHFFKDKNIINYLACEPFNQFLYSLKLTRVNIHLRDDERQFVNFILLYKKIKGKRVNPLLDTPPDILFFDSPTVGWRENTRYEEELNRYRMSLADSEHRGEILETKRRKLWESAESEIFRYVEQEEGATICVRCLGKGRRLAIGNGDLGLMSEVPADIEITEEVCPTCQGTGTTGYIPRVTPEQRKVADAFREKLESFDEPIFPDFPCKKKPVYIRLTYEGQIFLKSK
ncbi:MAG: hypothetical protein MUF15_03725 [Acidobacteria bacterium]|jgi:hypothetical protein|nr:hypothetical protein [Acidobacteriota bacterium]